VYTLEQSGALWSYVFFENFAVILFTTFDENEIALKKMMMALGRAISSQFGGLISSWSGNIGEFEGMDSLVDRYVGIDLELPSDAILDGAYKLMNNALEDHEIAYVGLLDARGNLLRGNICCRYGSYRSRDYGIQCAIAQGTFLDGGCGCSSR
jgi:hypothetical protein